MSDRASRNIALYPWFRFSLNLVFWQAIWFLYFQSELSAADAILLYVCYDLASTAMEVPSGYMADRLGRRITLLLSAAASLLGAVLLVFGGGFAAFALAQVLLGTSAACASGTDSALLYESLAEAGREDEIEAQELRGWRFSFVALALSASLGGVMSLYGYGWSFAATALAMAAALLLALCFAEPKRQSPTVRSEWARLLTLRDAFRHPTLIWLFALSVLMYGYSHLPFVFGQPYINEALSHVRLQAETPLVSGLVTALMMGVSVVTSLVAPQIRQRLGLPAILLLAYGIQVAICLGLILSNAVVGIAFLFLRMVPNSLSRPFILATIQPHLQDQSRATYLSLQSFLGRLLFAASLYAVAGSASDTGAMSYPEIQRILTWYVGAGVICLATLALTLGNAQLSAR